MKRPDSSTLRERLRQPGVIAAVQASKRCLARIEQAYKEAMDDERKRCLKIARDVAAVYRGLSDDDRYARDLQMRFEIGCRAATEIADQIENPEDE